MDCDEPELPAVKPSSGALPLRTSGFLLLLLLATLALFAFRILVFFLVRLPLGV